MRSKLKDGEKVCSVCSSDDMALFSPNSIAASVGALVALAYLRLRGVGSDMVESLVHQIAPWVIAVAMG